MHERSCVDIPANIVDILLLVLGEQEEHQRTFSCRLCLWVVFVDAGNVGSLIDFVHANEMLTLFVNGSHQSRLSNCSLLLTTEAALFTVSD